MGNVATSEDVVSTVAESVSLVNHQISAKRTNALPTIEKAWLTQTVKKRTCHRLCLAVCIVLSDQV
jgi:hypothetical protein